MYKVMIADDEMLVRIGLRSMIDWEQNGFQIVAEAANGEAAFEKFLATRPELLITDIKMPKKDGFWLIRKVKEAAPETEIIVLTCYDEFDYVREALKLQVSDYLLKAEMEEQEIEELMASKRERLDERRKKSGQDQGGGEPGPVDEERLLGLLLDREKPLELLKEAFAKIGLPWGAHRYCFLQFDFSTSLGDGIFTREQSAQILSACRQMIVNRLGEGKNVCLSKQFGKSITCFLMAKNLCEPKLKKEIEYLRESVRQYFSIRFKSAASRIEDSVERAREDGEWLFRASDILFYVPDGNHVDQTDGAAEETGRVFPLSRERIRAICDCIEEADDGGVSAALDEIREELIRRKEPSIDAKLILVHVMNEIAGKCEWILSPGSEEVLNYQRDLLAAEDIGAVFGILRRFGDRLVEMGIHVRANGSETLVGKAVSYIEEHFAEKITLEEIAGHVGISKYYFSNLFKKIQGINFSAYLNQIRIERAKQLLMQPEATVASVSDQVGFHDQQYFSKTFKKVTGMTVTEYRAKAH